MKLETPIVRVFRGETWLAVYRSIAVRNRLGTPIGGPPRYFPWYFATKIKRYLPEVNFRGRKFGKVREVVLIFNSRKYEVVVVGQKKPLSV